MYSCMYACKLCQYRILHRLHSFIKFISSHKQNVLLVSSNLFYTESYLMGKYRKKTSSRLGETIFSLLLLLCVARSKIPNKETDVLDVCQCVSIKSFYINNFVVHFSFFYFNARFMSFLSHYVMLLVMLTSWFRVHVIDSNMHIYFVRIELASNKISITQCLD